MYLVLGRDRFYLVQKKHSDSTKAFSETDIINMLAFLIDNIFVMLGGRVFQQTVGIPMGTNCAPLLADLLLYSYKADFIQWLLKKNEKKLARSFNFTFRYIDDVFSLRNRLFNLKGGRGLWFFVSFRIFFSDNTRVRIFFFVVQSATFFSRI